MSREKPRAKGSGCYYQAPDGRWRAELTVGYTPEGKAIKWRGWYHKRADATSALAKAIADRDEGKPVVQPKTTVAEYLRDWLATVARTSTEGRTYRGYKQIVESHLIPTLGDTRLSQLTPRDVQALYNAKLDTLSPVTVGHIHACLHVALDNAVRWALLTRNVADAVRRPKVERREQHILDAEQCRRFVEAIKDDPLEAYYLLSITTGMRPAELRGLKWSDVDMVQGSIRLQRTLQRVPRRGWVEQDTKTHQARAVALPSLAVDSLRRHWVAQAEHRLAVGPAWTQLDLVFPNGIGRPIEPQNLMRRSFVPLLERAGLPRIRLYDLRHSAASLLLAMGVHPKVVQELLGHSTIRLTMDTYSHSVPTLQADAMAAMDNALGAIRGRGL